MPAAYLAAQKTLGVSAAAVSGKLACFEPRVTAALVCDTAVDMGEVIAAMPRWRRQVLPGREVFYLDGNYLAAIEHRLQVLRTTREGPLPGQTLVLLDAQSELVVELVPCECGRAQERSLLLERIRADTVLVADCNFCTTKFLFGLFRRGAFFVIRQHASTLTHRFEGRRRKMTAEKIDNGEFSSTDEAIAAAADIPRQFESQVDSRFRTNSMAELDAAEFSTEYLVEGVLVAGQPCVMEAGKKTLKTNIACDLTLPEHRAVSFSESSGRPRPFASR